MDQIGQIMPYITGIVLILVVAITMIATRALAYREQADMLKRGYVPKDYQPINQQVQAANNQPPTIAPAQANYPAYELPQLAEQGAPMPFSTGDEVKVQVNRYDLPTSKIDQHREQHQQCCWPKKE